MKKTAINHNRKRKEGLHQRVALLKSLRAGRRVGGSAVTSRLLCEGLRVGHRRRRGAVAPVVGGDFRAGTNACSVEAKVAVAQRTVGVDLLDLAGNVGVVRGRRAGAVGNAVVEGRDLGGSLLQDDGLDLHFTDLLEDGFFHDFNHDCDLLLDDGDFFSRANFNLFLLDNDRVLRGVEVALAVEVIEVAHRGKTHVVVERRRRAGDDFRSAGHINGLSACGSGSDKGNKERLGKHLDKNGLNRDLPGKRMRQGMGWLREGRR